jgi:exodeoxyribonuclease-3
VKITSWNVNGLRAALNKGLLDWIKSFEPDVLCLQEIKARPEQLEAAHMLALRSSFAELTWNPALRPGYSGVATLRRSASLTSQAGLGAAEFDSEGRVIVTHTPGFHLYNLYVPNGQHDHARVPFKLEFYRRLL